MKKKFPLFKNYEPRTVALNTLCGNFCSKLRRIYHFCGKNDIFYVILKPMHIAALILRVVNPYSLTKNFKNLLILDVLT